MLMIILVQVSSKLCVRIFCKSVPLPYSGVGVTFLFGFLLLILAALTFFMGANILKSCQAMEGPGYEFFTEVCMNIDMH